MVEVYTIGHGARTKENFLNLLRKNNVEVVVDVRRWPTSKVDHFKRENLEGWLGRVGIGYIWLGDELGGFRKGGYARYVDGDGFKAGIEKLMKIASKRRACIMCLEVSPKGCHRRFISQHLRSRGVKVIHILSAEKIIYEETPAELLKGIRLQ